MSGKIESEKLAKAAGYAVADSSRGFFWFKVLFPEERSKAIFPTAAHAWNDCVVHNQLQDA